MYIYVYTCSEHDSDIGWRVGDFCWAWLAEERDYFAAWYQGPNKNNPNDQDVVGAYECFISIIQIKRPECGWCFSLLD